MRYGDAKPPAFRRLPVGAVFTVRTGPRRIVWKGQLKYFTRANVRYYCLVLTVADEVYRNSYGWLRTRCVADVKIAA